jgi:non-homologous end joining protein Ku
MANARKSGTTVLQLGLIRTPVVLYKAVGKGTDAPRFLKAGPNGRPLEEAAAQNGKRMKQAVAEVTPGSRSGTLQDDAVDNALDTHVGEIVDSPAEPEEAPVTQETFEVGQDVPLDLEKDLREGVRVGEDGDFVDLTKQLDYVRETTVLDEMQTIGFIPRTQVPRYRVQEAYYLGNDAEAGGTPHALALLLHGMKESGRVPVVRWSKQGGRQAMGAIVPAAKGALTLLQLAWEDEVRAVPPKALTHTKVDVEREEVDAFLELITALSTPGRDSLDVLRDERKEQEQLLVRLAEEGAVSEFQMEEPEELDTPDLPLVDLVRRSTAAARTETA